jgi:hypothetical protein
MTPEQHLALCVLKQAYADLRGACPWQRAEARAFFRADEAMLDLWCQAADVETGLVLQHAAAHVLQDLKHSVRRPDQLPLFPSGALHD